MTSGNAGHGTNLTAPGGGYPWVYFLEPPPYHVHVHEGRGVRNRPPYITDTPSWLEESD